MSNAEAKSKVCIIVLLMRGTLRLEVLEERSLILSGMRSIYRHQSIVNCSFCRMALIDTELEVANGLVLGGWLVRVSTHVFSKPYLV